MEATRRVFSASILSLLAILLCIGGFPILLALYVAEGAWRAVREVSVALWAFVRLPWVV